MSTSVDAYAEEGLERTVFLPVKNEVVLSRFIWCEV